MLNYFHVFLVQGLLVQGTHSRLHILGLVLGLGEYHPTLQEETNSTLGVVQSHHTPQVRGEVPPILDVCDNGHAHLILQRFTSFYFNLVIHIVLIVCISDIGLLLLINFCGLITCLVCDV